MEKIPLFKVQIHSLEKMLRELKKVFNSGYIGEGEKVKKFEKELGNFLNCSSIPLSTNSCTSALQLAYRCSNVKDKIVLATPMTCAATNIPILNEGGKVVFCDINPNSGNISPESVKENIEKYGVEKIAAISFSDFGGYPATLDKLIELSKKYSIPLIEDASDSLGAKYRGKKIGTIKEIDYSCLSFQAVKQITTVDGGALICQNSKKRKFAKKLRWYGIDRDKIKGISRWQGNINERGYKFHMNNITASIGIEQIKYLKKVIQKQRENAKFFDEDLALIPGLEIPKKEKNVFPTYPHYLILVDSRNNFIKSMLEKGIDVGIVHKRNDKYSCFKNDFGKEDLPGLEIFNSKYVFIPSGQWINKENREYIAETIKKGW